MKPLVNYCRWHQAKLLLRGRDAAQVWGHLQFSDGSRRFFRYLLGSRVLLLAAGETESEPLERLQLDEVGVVVGPASA